MCELVTQSVTSYYVTSFRNFELEEFRTSSLYIKNMS